MTPPLLPASWVNSSVCVCGFHVEPSMLLKPVLPVGADRREERDAVRGIGDVEVDPSDVGKTAAVFMALEEEVLPVVVALASARRDSGSGPGTCSRPAPSSSHC